MVCCMKTTVDLPDELLIEAKKRAAELRRPLRQLIADGLRAQLEATAPGQRPAAREIRWVTVPGGLPPGLDVADRESLSDWILRERHTP